VCSSFSAGLMRSHCSLLNLILSNPSPFAIASYPFSYVLLAGDAADLGVAVRGNVHDDVAVEDGAHQLTRKNSVVM